MNAVYSWTYCNNKVWLSQNPVAQDQTLGVTVGLCGGTHQAAAGSQLQDPLGTAAHQLPEGVQIQAVVLHTAGTSVTRLTTSSGGLHCTGLSVSSLSEARDTFPEMDTEGH